MRGGVGRTRPERHRADAKDAKNGYINFVLRVIRVCAVQR
jgi:hypothetical protein